MLAPLWMNHWANLPPSGGNSSKPSYPMTRVNRLDVVSKRKGRVLLFLRTTDENLPNRICRLQGDGHAV